jgi:hypothetical protein
MVTRAVRRFSKGMTSVTTFEADAFVPTANRLWLTFHGNSQARFGLREQTSPVLLELQIKAAMRSGDAMTVELEPEGVAKQRRIIINPHALPFVILSEGE